MSKALIDRYFCHYTELEEYQAGMWRSPNADEFRKMQSKARNFMMDLEKFSGAMGVVCSSWTNSCKSNFTTPSINPVAWLGQAAVCVGANVPERCTRQAWGELPFPTQVKANSLAKTHIDRWWEENAGQGRLFDV